MKKLKLTQGRFAIIDDINYDRIKKHKWHYDTPSNMEYARRTMKKENGGKNIRMHREIMGFPEGIVDHINGNGLDNRRNNLRVVSKSMNALNSEKAKRYYYDKFRGVYRAKVQIDGKVLSIGSFRTEKSAKIAVKAFIGNHVFFKEEG